MLRRVEPHDPADPRPSGARARVAALRRDGPEGGVPGSVRVESSAPGYDAAPVPGVDPGDRGRSAGDQPGSAAVGGPGGDGAAGRPEAGAEPAPGGWVPDRRIRAGRAGSVWAARLTTAGPWGELAEKWVPESLRGARVDPKRRGALLLSAVAAVAALAAALGVWWSRPQPTPVLPGSSAGSSADAAALLGVDPDVDAGDAGGPGTAHGGAGVPDAGRVADRSATPDSSVPPEATGTIVVSVTGDVRHPGLVTVPADARVADAIASAGGAQDASDLTGLNLAARLTDGASVVVAGGGGGVVTPDSTATGGGSGGRVADAKVSLNTADSTQLQTLAGIGPVTAAAIIAYRTEHGPFTDLAQLQEVSGIGPATFARLEPHVTL